MFVVVRDGLYWVGGGWCNAPKHAFLFTSVDLAADIAEILGASVAALL